MNRPGELIPRFDLCNFENESSGWGVFNKLVLFLSVLSLWHPSLRAPLLAKFGRVEKVTKLPSRRLVKCRRQISNSGLANFGWTSLKNNHYISTPSGYIVLITLRVQMYLRRLCVLLSHKKLIHQGASRLCNPSGWWKGSRSAGVLYFEGANAGCVDQYNILNRLLWEKGAERTWERGHWPVEHPWVSLPPPSVWFRLVRSKKDYNVLIKNI